MNNDKVYASIITIGDELLIGQTIDTNSAWMAKELNQLGIWVRRRVAVGDIWDDIWSALDEESQQSSIILITGGLGPTADDITKPLMCKYFSGKMVVDKGALQNVKDIFEKYIKRPMLDVNLKQAEVPDVCTVIQNKRGTAPGMWFEKEGKVFVSMPGVPDEMKGMMTDYVLPRLPSMFEMPAVIHRTLLTAGLGESYIAARINEFENALPPHIKLAYLPNFGMVRLRLTATGKNQAFLSKEIDVLFTQLQEQLKDVLVINEDKTLEEAIGILLLKVGKTVATAESCTGGYISHLITSIPGSSKYFLGGIVSYDNSIKQQVLQVRPETLANFGAVSEETVIQMAESAKKIINSNYAVAVSGIMGPGGGSEEKPVGTVWVAVAGESATITRKFQTRYARQRNIEVTAINALNLLRQAIVADLEADQDLQA